MTDKKTAEKKSKQHTIYKNKNDQRLPGVTTILSVMAKPALIKWANNLGLQGIDSYKYVDVLANIGTLTHAMIHYDLGGIKPDFDSYSKDDISLAENAFLKYLDWKNKNPFELIKTEIQVVSEKHQFGGTADLVIRLNDTITLLDIKTGKAVYKEAYTQVAAYSIALQENGYDIIDHLILRIGRNENEGFEFINIPNIELHKKRFLICKELYDINKLVNKKTFFKE